MHSIRLAIIALALCAMPSLAQGQDPLRPTLPTVYPTVQPYGSETAPLATPLPGIVLGQAGGSAIEEIGAALILLDRLLDGRDYDDAVRRLRRGDYFLRGSRRNTYGIPPGHYPPPGECRIWHPDRPPGHQPPPFRC